MDFNEEVLLLIATPIGLWRVLVFLFLYFPGRSSNSFGCYYPGMCYSTLIKCSDQYRTQENRHTRVVAKWLG